MKPRMSLILRPVISSMRVSPLSFMFSGLLDSLSFNAALRIEWCRSRSRYFRWDEEVLYLVVEMIRTKQYFTRRADWWEERADIRTVDDIVLASGLRAYSLRQAAILDRMSQKCDSLWEFAGELIPTE